jgi:hypothetical protein
MTRDISSQGIITYGGNNDGLVFKSDFENGVTTTRPPSAGNSIHFNDVNGNPVPVWWDISNTNADSDIWIEGLDYNRLPTGVQPHSGTRCVGLSVNQPPAYRSQVDTYIKNLVGNEYYCKGWYYFPTTWTMNTGDAAIRAGNYFSFVGLYIHDPDWSTIIELQVHLQNVVPWNGKYFLSVSWRGPSSYTPEWNTFQWTPILGRWFPVEWYCKMGDGIGVLKVWVDGVLVCDRSSLTIPTSPYIVFPQVYYDTSDGNSKTIWLDDIELWNRMPP